MASCRYWRAGLVAQAASSVMAATRSAVSAIQKEARSGASPVDEVARARTDLVVDGVDRGDLASVGWVAEPGPEARRDVEGVVEAVRLHEGVRVEEVHQAAPRRRAYSSKVLADFMDIRRIASLMGVRPSSASAIRARERRSPTRNGWLL